jgi:hypothetical protein
MAVKIDPVQARTHALNVEGIFFQQRVSQICRESGWLVTAEEYPVAYPPGNGPIVGKEGRLDIRAEKQFTDYRTVLVVECKKTNADYKDWVFFLKGEGRITAALIKMQGKPGAAEAATGKSKWDVSTNIAYFTSGLVAQDARELRAEYGKPESWKSSTARIETACYQAVQAAQALVDEVASRQQLLLSHGREPEPSTWIIPVVVTTANMMVCRFDLKDVALETGEIDWKKVSFEPRDAIAYEYPLPVHLQMKPAEPIRVEQSRVEDLVKKHVLVVKAASLEGFLKQADLGTSPATVL